MGQQSLTQPRRPEWFFFNEREIPVSTFKPMVTGLIRVVGSDDEREEVKIRLFFKDRSSTEVTVQLSELNHVDWSGLDHRCLLNSEYRQAKGYLANIIRAGIINAPVERKHILERTGIHHIDDAVVYAAGDRIIARSLAPETGSDLELGQLPFRLDIDESISAHEAIEGMLELVGLSPEIGSVLLAHVISGIVRAAFKEAGLTPCAVLVVVGKSGMLKSHYVPHLAQLYNRADGIGAVTRFNSTGRFIEDTLYEYSECSAVIDDLHTAESRSIKRRNEETAEEIIRRISDDTGRGRMDGRTQVQRHFRGNAVFIGEYAIGKASTIPRALIVELTKPPNGAILDEYQRGRPLLVSTFYYYFIQWYVDHYEEVKAAIDAELTRLRKTTASSTTHGRLRDTQFYLQTSYQFFCQFCIDSGYCSVEDARDTYRDFIGQLSQLIQAQQARFEQDNDMEIVDYLRCISQLYHGKQFRVAKEKEDFDPEKHDGVIYYNCLCLRGKRLEKRLSKMIPNFDWCACKDSLLNSGALKLVGHKSTVQIDGFGGKRFYAIRLDKLR